MKKTTLAAALWAVCVAANAGWYGESNYADCVLQNSRDANNPEAVAAVKQACRNKFTGKPDSPTSAADECQNSAGENGYGSYHHCKPKKIEANNPTVDQ